MTSSLYNKNQEMLTMNRPKSQEVKCTVKSCRHHDKDKHCTLTDIVIGENVANATEKCQTDCMSFEAL